MLRRDRFWLALFFIGIASILTGLLQLLAPEFCLRLITTSSDSLHKHLIASLGMVVAMFGAMFVFAILDDTPQYMAVLWTGIQKIGTAIAVGIGVQHATFIAPMIGFALFDLFAGSMIIAYWYGLRQMANESRVSR